MTNVFVSRPTWIASSFQEGLSGFLRVLETLGLQPKTIGVTVYPTEAPLDEVIRLMGECAGAVVLGYPQIVVRAGTLKGEPTPGDFILPTEWNHIEAALAYARGLPLLVIHHVGIRRGIFDRGAISHFIYEIDLADPAWALHANVHGALTAW